MNTWQKLSAGDPRPVPAWYGHWKGGQWVQHFFTETAPSADTWAYVMPCPIPAPPPRELTQVEKDAAEYVRWHKMQGKLPWPCDAWHAALKWEREQAETALLALAYELPHVPGRYLRLSDVENFFRARREGGAK